MPILTIEIPDDQMEVLARRAESLGLSVPELVSAAIEELLAQIDLAAHSAITDVLANRPGQARAGAREMTNDDIDD